MTQNDAPSDENEISIVPQGQPEVIVILQQEEDAITPAEKVHYTMFYCNVCINCFSV